MFVVDQWLAVDRDPFSDEVDVPACGTVDDPYYLIKSNGNRKLMDDHLWLSVFSRK